MHPPIYGKQSSVVLKRVFLCSLKYQIISIERNEKGLHVGSRHDLKCHADA